MFFPLILVRVLLTTSVCQCLIQVDFCSIKILSFLICNNIQKIKRVWLQDFSVYLRWWRALCVFKRKIDYVTFAEVVYHKTQWVHPDFCRVTSHRQCLRDQHSQNSRLNGEKYGGCCPQSHQESTRVSEAGPCCPLCRASCSQSRQDWEQCDFKVLDTSLAM